MMMLSAKKCKLCGTVSLRLIFVLLLVVSIFAKSHLFVEQYVFPKWFFSFCCIVLFLFVFLFFGKKSIYIQRKCLSESFIKQSIGIIVLLQALWGWYILLINEHITIIAGSFDNPTGYASCLVISLPFILVSVKTICGKCIISIFIILSIVMSQSRTGLICIFVIFLFLSFKRFNLIKIIYTVVLVLLLIYVLSFFKHASFAGRFFIFQLSLDMLLDKPLLGFGRYGFETNYMKYQARYFMDNPMAPEIALADMVKTPLNEYMYISINYGLITLAFCLLLIVLVFRHCNREHIFLRNPFLLLYCYILVFLILCIIHLLG